MKRFFAAVLTLISVASAAVFADDTPVAKVGGVTLNEKQMLDELSMSLYTKENEIYQMKREWIDRQSKNVLFDKAAKDAKMSRKEWEKKNLTPVPPTSQEIDEMVKRIPPNQMPEAGKMDMLRKQMAESLTGQKKSMKENEVYRSLVQSNPVEVLLTAPTPPAVKIPPNAPVKGPENAKVTIFEFTDFECPWCKRSQDALKSVESTYPGQVRFVDQMFPLTQIHPRAMPSAEAAYCAKEQGKYWEFRDKLFESSPNLADADFKRIAKELGLKEGKFDTCMKSGSARAHVQADLATGQTFGVKGTPAFFVNGAQTAFPKLMETVKAELDKK